jgi:hypothetical protein
MSRAAGKPSSEFPRRREAPSALYSWQKSRLLPAANVVGLRPASAGPNKESQVLGLTRTLTC